MSEILVRPVKTRKERRIFLNFPWQIYQNDPLWVPPLMPDMQERIDRKRGVFFKRGEADFFIAWRDGEPVGTICAAEDRQSNAERGDRECMFGFFNFVEDYAVMEALLGRVRDWAHSRDLHSLTGPYNLDYEDSYGILVEGRDRPPVLMCGHTPPYYLDFVERYGFVPGRPGDNIAYQTDLQVPEDDPRLQRLARIVKALERRGHVTARPARMAEWNSELDYALRILNKGLAVLADFSPWDRGAFAAHAEALRAIMDPDLVIFGLVDDEPVGWALGLPNLNEAVQKADGLRHLWDYPRLWWYARRRPDCVSFKSIAVDPDHWSRGVDAVMVYALVQAARAKGYRWMDLSLTSTDNPMTPLLAERMGAELYRRYRVYRRAL